MSKKTIIQIISRLNIGGPSRILLYNHQELKKIGYESIIITGHPPSYEREIVIPEDCKQNIIYIEGLSPSKSLFQTLIAFYKIYNLLRKLKPIVIHSHQSKAGAIGRICGFLAGIQQRIHTYHGHLFYGYYHKTKTKLIILIEQLLSKLSTNNIAISPQIFQDVVYQYRVSPERKTRLIHIGIHPNYLKMSLSALEFKKRFDLPLSKKIIGFVGRLEPIKAPEDFIELIKSYSKIHPDCHFVIAGGGSLEQKVHQLINDNNLTASVKIIPWVQNIEEILVCLDLLVLTSKNEGTPLIILEAMAVNTLVLATKVGGVPDIITHGQNGFLFSQKNPISFEKDLEAILQLTKPEIIKIKENARIFVKEKYTLDQQFSQILNLYSTTIKKHFSQSEQY